MEEKMLSHIDEGGKARMVDVSSKPVTMREAVAEGRITMAGDTLEKVRSNALVKGDVLAVARLAGIMGAKRTGDLIPLCHPLGLDLVDVDFELDPKSTSLRIQSKVRMSGRTGVEMEALTAVSIAALTIYDMCKAVDKTMEIHQIRLVSKSKTRVDSLS